MKMVISQVTLLFSRLSSILSVCSVLMFPKWAIQKVYYGTWIVKLVWFYVNMSSLVASLHLFLFSLCSGWNCTLCFLQGSHFGGLWKAWSGCWLHQCLPRAITNSSASTHNGNSMVRRKKYSHPRYGHILKNACKVSLVKHKMMQCN